MAAMHPYATDSNERTQVPLMMVVACIPLAWLLRTEFERFNIDFPWWFDAPSILGFYALLYFLFDRYLWKWQFLRKIGLTELPNLNGVWKGMLTPNGRSPRDVEITITQTWSNISVKLKTKHSSSRSLIATVLLAGRFDDVLSYQYLNEPKAGTEIDMHTHRGTAWLTLTPDETKLDGEYSTGTGQKNFGRIAVERG